jgi:DNA-binding NarL/FixJ family response regulator
MPVKDGIDCLKEIKLIEKNKEIRIVMYSTSGNTNDVENSYANGALFYLEKPHTEEALSKAVSAVLKHPNFISNTVPERDSFVITA